jgi:hypothetical protein
MAMHAKAALASKVRRTVCAGIEDVAEFEPTKVAKAFSRSAIPLTM